MHIVIPDPSPKQLELPLRRHNQRRPAKAIHNPLLTQAQIANHTHLDKIPELRVLKPIPPHPDQILKIVVKVLPIRNSRIANGKEIAVASGDPDEAVQGD